MTLHKHHDLIIAWAKGAQIQCQVFGKPNKWFDIKNPDWLEGCTYRIKPNPDVVLYKYVDGDNGWAYYRKGAQDVGVDNKNKANLKLTVDGETGKLKKAEVINEE